MTCEEPNYKMSMMRALKCDSHWSLNQRLRVYFRVSLILFPAYLQTPDDIFLFITDNTSKDWAKAQQLQPKARSYMKIGVKKVGCL